MSNDHREIDLLDLIIAFIAASVLVGLLLLIFLLPAHAQTPEMHLRRILLTDTPLEQARAYAKLDGLHREFRYQVGL
jgi:hypothetical protein